MVNIKEDASANNNHKGVNQIIKASAASDGIESDIMLKYEPSIDPTDKVKVIKGGI